MSRKKMTLPQQKLFHREAVLRSLEEFYGLEHPSAVNVVYVWWNRMMESGSLKSGFFLHDEPISTAADLLQAPETPPTPDFWSRYDEKVLKATELYLKPLMESPERVEHALMHPEKLEGAALWEPMHGSLER